MREGWKYMKLGEVCETTSGGTPSKSRKEYYEGGTIPWLRTGEVKQGEIQQFAARIQSIEQQKQLLKASIKEAETLFQSRMDYWFNE